MLEIVLRATATGHVATDANAGADAPSERAHALVRNNLDFVWRSLFRLGVPRSEVDDAAQQVFLAAAAKVERIELGSERSFLFGIAMRIASRARRASERRAAHEAPSLRPEPIDVRDSAPAADELLDRKRARELLDEALVSLPMDLRAVFVLFELEGMTMAQMADVLDLPPGTVASRLRRARGEFRTVVQRLQARQSRTRSVR
jgi:RNA polymerase sigma-70 factor (ECF subfamily)